MKYVLAEISRRNISLHYCDGENGNRTFEVFGSGSIPLALAYQNEHFVIGQTAKQAVDSQQANAFYNLFDYLNKGVYCSDVPSRSFIPKVISVLLDELCRERFYDNFRNLSKRITLVLLFRNDVPSNDIHPIVQDMEAMPFAELKAYDQSLESVKYFRSGSIYDWSGESNAMVVMSDNEDFSVKCYSLTDNRLQYEYLYKGQGSDPRLDFAAEKIWNDIRMDVCFTKKENALPIIKNAINEFLASKKLVLRYVKLPDDGELPVLLTRNSYYSYSPSSGNQFMTIANDVIRKAGLDNDTTGVVLQGYAADNEFFRESFKNLMLDPLSDENDAACKGIRDNLLREMMGLKESIELDSVSVECPCEGGTIKVGVTASPAGVMYKAFTEENWIELMLGTNSIGIDVRKNETREKRNGEIIVTSAYGSISKVLKVTQFGEAILPDLPQDDPTDDGKRKFNMSYSLSNEKRKQFLTVEVEVLDDKALPFDCMFTIDNKNFMSYKPDESFCEECKKGQKGILKFGPYELPIPKIGSGKVLYAHIWPADKNIMPNVFRKNHIKIQL